MQCVIFKAGEMCMGVLVEGMCIEWQVKADIIYNVPLCIISVP